MLSPIGKVIMYQEVEDFARFKSYFDEGFPLRLSAGEISEEIGILHEQPNMVYFISEWTLVENFRLFILSR